MNTTDELRDIIHYLRDNADSFIIVILGLMIFFQFCFLSYSVSMNVESWPIINARDNDGANAIRVAECSNWLRDNGWYPYGNLYFNLAHTIEKFNPLTAGQTITRNSLINDKGHHFALMLISLCSLFGITYLISSVIANSSVCKLLSMFALNSVLIKNEYWTTWVFRAHPDIFLCFLIALAMYFSIKYMLTPLNKFFYLSSISWGLALATKMTAVIFLPALFIVFVPPFDKVNLFKSFKYYLIILISYLLIGFPQNFKIWQHLAFVKDQSIYSLAPTFDSVTEWVFLMINQSVYLIITIIILKLIFCYLENTKSDTFNRMTIIKAGVLVLFPFGFLLSQRIINLHQHYTLPIAGCLLVLVAYLTSSFTQNVYVKAYSTVRSRIIIILTITILILFFRLTPNSVPEVLSSQTHGRSEAKEFVMEIARYQKENFKILADPYLPWDENLGNVSVSYYHTINDIRPGNADILALSRNFYIRYLENPPSIYVLHDAPNWRDVRKFYEIFANREQTVDPYNKKWIKVHSNPQGWEIWELKK